MGTVQAHEEINEANFTYLLLARQMIQEDKDAAMFCLGITQEMAERVARMSPAQFLTSPTELHGYPC